MKVDKDELKSNLNEFVDGLNESHQVNIVKSKKKVNCKNNFSWHSQEIWFF